jgi:hypothetical protein
MSRAVANASPVGASDLAGQHPRTRGWADLFVTLYMAVHLFWIYFTAMVGRLHIEIVHGGTSSTAKQIVVIGDDLAYGVGDWATLMGYPGIHRRFNEQIAKDEG